MPLLTAKTYQAQWNAVMYNAAIERDDKQGESTAYSHSLNSLFTAAYGVTDN